MKYSVKRDSANIWKDDRGKWLMKLHMDIKTTPVIASKHLHKRNLCF